MACVWTIGHSTRSLDALVALLHAHGITRVADVRRFPRSRRHPHVNTEALVEWCRARLAYFKAPGWVLFVPALPTTGTQKVQKTQIFPRGEDPRQRPGALDLRETKKRR